MLDSAFSEAVGATAGAVAGLVSIARAPKSLDGSWIIDMRTSTVAKAPDQRSGFQFLVVATVGVATRGVWAGTCLAGAFFVGVAAFWGPLAGERRLSVFRSWADLLAGAGMCTAAIFTAAVADGSAWATRCRSFSRKTFASIRQASHSVKWASRPFLTSGSSPAPARYLCSCACAN